MWQHANTAPFFLQTLGITYLNGAPKHWKTVAVASILHPQRLALVLICKPAGLKFHMVSSYLVAISAKVETPGLDVGLIQLGQCCLMISFAPYIYQEQLNPT